MSLDYDELKEVIAEQLDAPNVIIMGTPEWNHYMYDLAMKACHENVVCVPTQLKNEIRDKRTNQMLKVMEYERLFMEESTIKDIKDPPMGRTQKHHNQIMKFNKRKKGKRC